MAEDEKVPARKQCEGEVAKAGGGRPRPRNQDVLPVILGKQFRAAYGELLNSPVPDAITQLIKRLESQEPAPLDASDKPRREES